MWKEAVVAYFKEIFQHVLSQIQGGYKRPQIG
jgi:hypothetical protein